MINQYKKIVLLGGLVLALLLSLWLLSLRFDWFSSGISTCADCTKIISRNVSRSITLEDGDVLCIGKNGKFTGTIYRWDGQDTVTICNEGIFNPTKLSIHSGKNVIKNYGSMSPEYMRIFSKSIHNLIINYDGATLSPQKMYMGRANYILKNYGDFSPDKLHVPSESVVYNYQQANITNQKLRITGHGQVVNNGFWWVEEPLTEKELSQISNQGEMITGGYPLRMDSDSESKATE